MQNLREATVADLIGMKRSKSKKKEEEQEAVLHSNEVRADAKFFITKLKFISVSDHQPTSVLLLRSGHPEASRKVRSVVLNGQTLTLSTPSHVAAFPSALLLRKE